MDRRVRISKTYIEKIKSLEHRAKMRKRYLKRMEKIRQMKIEREKEAV